MPQANFEEFVCNRSQCEIKEAIRTDSGQNLGAHLCVTVNFGHRN
jgi:hypothetical protein